MKLLNTILILFKIKPKSSFLLITLLTLASGFEAAGIGFLIPMLETIGANESDQSTSKITQYLMRTFEFLNIPFNLATILSGGFILFAIQAVLRYLSGTESTRVGGEIAAQFKTKLFSNILHMDLGYIHKRKESEFINSIITEPTRIQAAYFSSINMVAIICESIMYLTIALLISWPLVLIGGGIISLITLIVKYELKRADQLGDELVIVNEKQQSTVSEHLSGIRILKSFNLEKISFNKLKEQADIIPQISYSVSKSRFRLENLFRLGMVGGMSLIVYISISVFTIPTQLLLTLMYVVYKFYPKIGAINSNLHQINYHIPGINRVLNFIKETESPKIISGKKDFKELKSHVEFKNISFAYEKDNDVVNNISFNIKSGSTTAIVGGSGSGKTTLTNLIMRFYDLDSGEILIDETDLRKFNIDSWRKNISLVNQDIFLFNDTIKNNILMGKLDASNDQIIHASNLANADEFINELPEKYDTLIGDSGVLLSGGQRQRIALARAIIRNPQILILDEATSELDSKSEQLIHESVEKLGKNKTVIIIAHRLSTIKNADKIIVLFDGKIVEEGTHESLVINDSHYSEFLKIQQTAIR